MGGLFGGVGRAKKRSSLKLEQFMCPNSIEDHKRKGLYVKLERFLCPSSIEDPKKKGLHLKLERLLCPNSLEIQNKKHIRVPKGGRYSPMQKSVSKVLKTGHFHILHTNGGGYSPPPGYATAIKWSKFHSHPGQVVAYLNKTLYDDYFWWLQRSCKVSWREFE